MKYSNHTLSKKLDRSVEQAHELVDKQHQQYLNTVVTHESRTFASKDLPNPTEPTISPYTSSIEGAYNGVKNDVALMLRGGIQKSLGSVNLVTANQKIENVNQSIKRERDEKQALICDIDRIMPDYSYSEYKKQRMLLWLFGLGECAWTIAAFLKFGDILLVAIIIGLIIGLAQITVSVRAVQIIKEIRSKAKQRLYFWILFTAFLILSLIMGSIRYYFAHVGTASSMSFLTLNPFTFAAFNMLLISATCLTVYFFYPGKADLKKFGEIAALERIVSRKCKRINALDDFRSSLMNDREMIMELHTRIIHDEKVLHKKIDSCYDEAIGRFKHENVIKRPDGLFPECFKHPHDPLSTSDLEQNLINKNQNK
jgi:hypothetical protein